MATKRAARKIVPMTATRKQICEISHDNVIVGGFSILVDPGSNRVYLDQGGIQKFEIPRMTFNKLILWYTQNRVPKEDAKDRKREARDAG